ncbi:unnamed protein product, partial [Ectocarpus sp. 12 AP-2014]
LLLAARFFLALRGSGSGALLPAPRDHHHLRTPRVGTAAAIAGSPPVVVSGGVAVGEMAAVGRNRLAVAVSVLVDDGAVAVLARRRSCHFDPTHLLHLLPRLDNIATATTLHLHAMFLRRAQH